MTGKTGNRARVRRAAVERLALAAAARDRGVRDLAAAGTIDDRRGRRGALRAAVAALRAAVLGAHRAGVPTTEIATTAGTTTRAVSMTLLRRERAVTTRWRAPTRTGDRRTRALDDVTDAVREHGTAHPATHHAIRTAHDHGVSPAALARAADLRPGRLAVIVMASTRPTRPGERR